MSVMVDIADAITTALNGSELGITAQRSYADIKVQLTDLGCLHVDVVPNRHINTDQDTRGSVGYQVTTDILIRKRFETVETDALTGRILIEEIDALVDLVEDIHEFFCADRLSDASWSKTECVFTYVREHLSEWRQFTGLLRLTHDVSVSL